MYLPFNHKGFNQQPIINPTYVTNKGRYSKCIQSTKQSRESIISPIQLCKVNRSSLNFSVNSICALNIANAGLFWVHRDMSCDCFDEGKTTAYLKHLIHYLLQRHNMKSTVIFFTPFLQLITP